MDRPIAQRLARPRWATTAEWVVLGAIHELQKKRPREEFQYTDWPTPLDPCDKDEGLRRLVRLTLLRNKSPGEYEMTDELWKLLAVEYEPTTARSERDLS